jgi:uroporphyrin-III C-methyltransferase
MELTKAKVYIVGAGPGDPGLITVKAMEKLKQADVVVFDRLINNDLLSYCKKDCEKIFVGKESGYHSIEQERIIDILLQKSKPGVIVVRLKGGNPFIFGRGSEEAAALKKEGIDFEVIPGITSGLSAPVYSGIPITQRGLITQCVLITAHECPGKPETQVEWEKLAKLKNTTLVIYMGASRIERICSELIKHGMSPSMPASAIENGTLPNQRTITARLDELAEEFKKQDFHAPVIILISPTVSLRNDISWFENKPLFNKRIVVAGDNDQTGELRDALYEMGGEVLQLPVINTQIRLQEDSPLNSIKEYGYTCRESPSGFQFVPWTNVKFGGDNSSIERMIRLNTENDFTIDVLHEELNDYRVNLPANEIFNVIQNEPDTEQLENIKKYGVDAFIFTSSVAVDNFFVLFGETAGLLLDKSKIVAMNNTAAKALSKKNVLSIMVPDNNSVKGKYDFIGNLFNRKNS